MNTQDKTQPILRPWVVIAGVLPFVLIMIGMAYLIGLPILKLTLKLATLAISLTLALLPFLVAVIVAIGRGAGRHPYANKRYREWLAYTPWSYGKPLPLGSIHLKWNDLIFVLISGGIAALGFWLCHQIGTNSKSIFEDVIPWQAAIALGMVYFVVYVISLIFMISDDEVVMWFVLALVPLTAYPHHNVWIGFGVLVVIYGLVLLGLQRTLGNFPWNRPEWTESPRQRMLKDIINTGILGWPYREVGPAVGNNKHITVVSSLAASAIMAWWTFAILHTVESNFLLDIGDSQLSFTDFIAHEQNEGMKPEALLWMYRFIVLFGALACAFAKLGRYTKNTHPPISLRGRIATGRWIIPGYDRVFIAPILILITVIAITEALLSMRLTPISLVPAITMFVLMFLLTVPYPSLEKWHYTGHFRIRHGKTGRQSASDKPRSTAQVNIKLPSSG